MKFSVCVDNGVFQKIFSISPPTSRWKNGRERIKEKGLR